MVANSAPERRRFLASIAGLPVMSALALDALWTEAAAQQTSSITKEMLDHALKVAGESFTDAELDAMIKQVNEHLRVYDELRRLPWRTA